MASSLIKSLSKSDVIYPKTEKRRNGRVVESESRRRDRTGGGGGGRRGSKDRRESEKSVENHSKGRRESRRETITEESTEKEHGTDGIDHDGRGATLSQPSQIHGERNSPLPIPAVVVSPVPETDELPTRVGACWVPSPRPPAEPVPGICGRNGVDDTRDALPNGWQTQGDLERRERGEFVCSDSSASSASALGLEKGDSGPKISFGR